jgi:hypothetical protein
MASKLKQLYRQGGMNAVRKQWKEKGLPLSDMPSEARLKEPGPLSGKPHHKPRGTKRKGL